jgi:TldD protein
LRWSRVIAITFLLAYALTPDLCAASLLDEARKDTQLRAMLDELARSKSLQLNNLDKPYFIEYDIGDTEEAFISANLGGILSSTRTRFRIPRLEVRVGDYKFDNTNSIYSGFARTGLLPIDDDYSVFRTNFWLATDGMYKAASEQMTRKRNALREIADPDKTPDFAPAPAVQLLDKTAKLELDQKHWEEVLRSASEKFDDYPDLRTSSVALRAIASTYRLVNTEGTIVRIPQNLNNIEIRAQAQSSDGSYVWNHLEFAVAAANQFPDLVVLTKAVDSISKETTALANAPIAEDYSGPVLFEQEAAAQLMASALSDAVRLHRKPLAPPGANSPEVLESVWASKLGSKVMPDWMSLVDDPGVDVSNGVALTGAYSVDDEGVKAQKVTIVDNGTLKGFLASREPVRDMNASNGHGRLPGGFGSQEGVIGNLFVAVQQPTPESAMKAKLMEKVKASGAKFGLLVRRLDFPYTADYEELQSLARQLQKSGYARTLSSPILAYRVYPDGREELVRGLRFKDFSAKDLRDIDAASDRPYVLNYINNGSAFDFADVSSDATTSAVICPSLLFDSLDLARAENEPGKQPIVPPPTLVAHQ